LLKSQIYRHYIDVNKTLIKKEKKKIILVISFFSSIFIDVFFLFFAFLPLKGKRGT